MARFNDLPIEIQTQIWELVLPYRGGMHWVEFEGVPRSPEAIRESLERTRILFDNNELRIKNRGTVWKSEGWRKHFWKRLEDEDFGTPFFDYIYTIVPSVWGSSRDTELDLTDRADTLPQEVVDEIVRTRRCRQLSTYTQIATLLLTCRISRLTALGHLEKIKSKCEWWLCRGVGPMHRPRPLNVWAQQYENVETNTRDGYQVLVPTIYAVLDLVVLRLHTTSGYPTPTLRYAHYQLFPEAYGRKVQKLPFYDRVGIEWHPLWATPEGRKEFCEDGIEHIIRLSGSHGIFTTRFYLLVDGIPRPRWDEHVPAIPAAFARVIEKKRENFFENLWSEVEDREILMLESYSSTENYDLHHEFEANGRRYYIVFVVADWHCEFSIEESFLDPALNWDGPFPGGEDLWPEALRAPARLAYDVRNSLHVNDDYSFILSWEPI